MTLPLSKEIAVAVDAVPAAGPFPVEVSAESPRARVSLALLAASSVGVAFESLTLHLIDTPRDVNALKAWGDRLSGRIRYLMEPLVVLEVDALGGEVELRSQSPTARDARRTYYEMRLSTPGCLALRRVAFDEATRTRSTVPCQLTREVLERLLDDLTATA